MALLKQAPQNNPGLLGRLQAAGLGDLLTGTGVGLLSQQPSQYPVSPWGGLAQGFQYANQMGQQRRDNAQQDQILGFRQQQADIQQQQFAAEQEQTRKQEVAQAEAMQRRAALREGVAPEQQKLFDLDPENFSKRLVEQSMPGAQNPQFETFREGSEDVTYQINQDGTRSEISRGLAWQPNNETGDNPEFSMSPFLAVDPKTGQLVPYQLSKSGGAVRVQLPDGQVPAQNIGQVDTGTGTALIGSKTGSTVGSIAKDVSGKAAATAQGTATGKARVDLPTVEGNAQLILKTIEQVRNHPGREDATGMSSVFNPLAIPGSDRKDFLVAKDQLKGQAFLQAFDSLRGGGAITELEGKAATEAKARLDTAQSEAEYLKALDDFAIEVNKLVTIARTKAGMAQGAGDMTDEQLLEELNK